LRNQLLRSLTKRKKVVSLVPKRRE
jgi:hypothetical protein